MGADSQHNKKLKAYQASFWVNLFLPPLKLVVGIWGKSSSLIADGINSLTDLVSNIVVYIFLKMSGKPRDDDHKYGHGKYETVAAFTLAAVMIVAGALIIAESISTFYLFFKDDILPATPEIAVLIAAVLSMILKEWVYRYSWKKAKETNSEALKAEALDHRSDVFTSLAVFIGAGGSILIGGWARLLEPLAAIAVAIFIIRMGVEVGKPSLQKLTDGSLPADVEREIIKIAKSVEGISDPHNLRTRMTGSDTVAIEMDVRVNGHLSLYEAHDLTIDVEDLLLQRFGENTHIIIHVEPELPYVHKKGGHIQSAKPAQ